MSTTATKSQPSRTSARAAKKGGSQTRQRRRPKRLSESETGQHEIPEQRRQWIEIDGEEIGAIKDAAEPFVDNPNRVLRRLLGLPTVDNDRTAPLPQTIPRVPRGSILPMPEFQVPILLAISEAGGSAPRSAVIDAAGVALKDRLPDLDREPLRSGRLRWQSRVDHVRNGLVKRSLLESDQPGIWTLTQAGIEYLDRRLKSKATVERRAK